MKKVRKIIAAILCFSLIIGTTAFAQEPTNDIVEKDASPYLKGTEETVGIDGTMYSYKYSLENGNKVTKITNEDTLETDVLVYDEDEGIFYLNGSVIAEVEDVMEEADMDTAVDDNMTAQAKGAPYKYLGAVNKKVTWKKGVAYTVAAAIIAAALVAMTGAMVIRKIGATSVRSFAKNCVGGTVKTKVYERKSGKVTNYKHVWSFTTSKGKKYGNYTSYATT